MFSIPHSSNIISPQNTNFFDPSLAYLKYITKYTTKITTNSNQHEIDGW